MLRQRLDTEQLLIPPGPFPVGHDLVAAQACPLPDELTEAASRTGQTLLAASALERLTEAVSAGGTDWGLGIYARCRALLSDGEDAEGSYREAIDRLSRTRPRPELARAHLLYGEWLRREGRRANARAQLRTAHEMFRRDRNGGVHRACPSRAGGHGRDRPQAHG